MAGTIFWATFILYYAALILVTRGLTFPIIRDELHYWPTTLRFAHNWPPSSALLRNYGELNTPLPFIVFGLIEKIGPGGIRYGRLCNLLLSMLTILIICRPQADLNRKRALAALPALLLSPYFMGVSTHLYTDMLAIFLSLCGCLFHAQRHHLRSLACFILAISTRQYMAAFPAALFLAEICQPRTKSFQTGGNWLFPLAALTTLPAWYLFFGGFGPAEEIARQHITTTSLFSLLPRNCNYFLACLGAYFCLPEIILNRALDFPSSGFPRSRRTVIAAGLLLGLSFILFPPLRNQNFPFPSMGFLDRFLRFFCSDLFRLALLYGLALLATTRFLNINRDFFLVWCNVLLMAKAHIAWDKYALPLVVILWFYWVREIPLPPQTRQPHSPEMLKGEGNQP